jgi:hypothetical protein
MQISSAIDQKFNKHYMETLNLVQEKILPQQELLTSGFGRRMDS